MDHQILQFGTPAGEYPEKPSAYAVVLYDNKLLCLLVRNKYHLPGGGLEGTEDPQLAVKREVMRLRLSPDADVELAEFKRQLFG